MLRFHDSNRKKRELEACPATDSKARAIATAICKRQETAARWINRKFDALPLHMKHLCLLLFCLLLGGASGWIVAQALLPGPKRTEAPGLQHILPSQAKSAQDPHYIFPPKKLPQQPQGAPDSLRHLD